MAHRHNDALNYPWNRYYRVRHSPNKSVPARLLDMHYEVVDIKEVADTNERAIQVLQARVEEMKSLLDRIERLLNNHFGGATAGENNNPGSIEY